MTRKKKENSIYRKIIVMVAVLVGTWCCYKLAAAFLLERRHRNVRVESCYRFGDLNSIQLVAARRNGVKAAKRRDDVPIQQLQHIASGGSYKVDHLTHSMPYLTSGAKDLLGEIGKRFQAKLRKKGYLQHRIIVTSVLRTKDDIANLQKTNGNSVSNSAHLYGTTFDIAYTRFGIYGVLGTNIRNQVMTDILGEVLKELRNEGLCYIKYERNQHCFHITSRL